MSEAVIFCEGYHDRAFWGGWLQYLGCINLYQPGKPPKDPFGKPVTGGGHHAYQSRSGAFIRIVPCDGKEKILEKVEIRVIERTTKPLTHVVINVDSDKNPDGTSSGITAISRESIEKLLQNPQIDPGVQSTAEGNFTIDGGATIISIVRWETSDPVAQGLPNQQTLERLVCAAMCAAYPERRACVHNWLDSRHQPPQASVKEYAWSYMAGWYAEQNCEAFYSCLWNDPKIVSELKSRLEFSGAWQIAEALAS